MNKLKMFFNGIPKYILGPIAVAIGIFYFWYDSPPQTVCDAQFATFKAQTKKYLYGSSKNGIVVPPLFMKHLTACRDSNTVGACYDWSEGLKENIRASRMIPEECRERLKEIEPLVSYYSASLRMYAQLSWNDTEIVRQKLFHWMDSEDLVIFCRVKAEYSRLMGEETYKGLEKALLKELITLKKLPPEETWKRTILSYNCAGI